MAWMIYGANGYTGELIAREARARGHTPILAGRSERSLQPLAQELTHCLLQALRAAFSNSPHAEVWGKC